MKFKKGDKVRIDKEILNHQDFFDNTLPVWFSNDIYTITCIIDDIAMLDSDLPNNQSNKIHCAYLKSLKEERKNKLLKIKSL